MDYVLQCYIFPTLRSKSRIFFNSRPPDATPRAEHSRQLSRQRDYVLRPKMNVVLWQLNFDTVKGGF